MHFDKRGRGGGGAENKELKGFVRFLGAVVSQFSMRMVCCTRTAINYGYFIAIRRVFRERLRLKQLSPASANVNTV